MFVVFPCFACYLFLPSPSLPVLQVGDALIAINNVTVQGWRFNEIMRKMKRSIQQDPCIVLRFRTMEERYRLLRMKVCTPKGLPVALFPCLDVRPNGRPGALLFSKLALHLSAQNQTISTNRPKIAGTRSSVAQEFTRGNPKY